MMYKISMHSDIKYKKMQFETNMQYYVLNTMIIMDRFKGIIHTFLTLSD
jgi:hypothetical protein